MPKVKPIVAKTPEELASNLGLSSAAAKEWQVQHMLLKRLKEIADVKGSRTLKLQSEPVLPEPG